MKNKSTLLSSAVWGKLDLLRRMLRSRLLVEGLSRLALAAAAGVAVTLGLDYSLRLDRPLRAAALFLFALFMLYVLWRRVVRPMLAPMHPHALALLLERGFPQINDRLMTALETTGESVSQAMLAQTAAEAQRIVPPLPVGKIVETRRLRRIVALAVAVGVLLTGFAILKPDVMQLWFQRNVLLADVDWPQQTYLSVYYMDHTGQLRPLLQTDGAGTILQVHETAEVLRGETLEVLVASQEGPSAPEAVTLHAQYPSVGDTEETLTPLPPDQAAQYQNTVLYAGKMPATHTRTWYRKRFAGVNEAFEFYAVGGDDRRDARRPHRVVLVEAPALREVRFTVVAPAYMRQPHPTVLPGSRGVLPIPHGATVHVSAEANKPIASARMQLNGRDAVEMNVETDDETTDASRRRLIGVLKPEGKNAPATRTLSFVLRDTAGYTNRRGETFLLQILPDLPPAVRLQSRGVRNVICPSARVPLFAEAKDDHGLASMRVVYRLSESVAAETQPTAKPAWQTVGKPIAISPDAPRQETGRRTLDLLPLKLPPGGRLIVRAEARDTLPKPLDGPNTARSAELSFEIIPREKLLAQLIGLQKEARMELFQATGQQAFSQGRCASAASELAGGTIPPESLRKLADAAARQRQVINESTKVADSTAAVATEMELNRLGQPEEHAALRDNVVAPLRKLIRRMRTAAADLDDAAAMTDAAAMARGAKTIAAKQQDIYDALEAILANMHKLENRLELARRLEGLLKMSVELDALLRQRVERGVEDIFEDENSENEK
ncbi:MAG: hypothetical protein JW849_02550 [Phycisphaerae bacterium]|nr:hypothetical protein [Phycisphaerae bacterium]